MISVRRKIAARTYGAVAIGSFVFGLIYLFRNSFMPYHSVAVGKDWDAVDPAMQVLLLALIHAAGGAMVAVGVLAFSLAYFALPAGERWARIVLPAGLLVFYGTALYATLSVLSGTPAAPPWYGAALACAVTAAALVLDAPWSRDRENG